MSDPIAPLPEMSAQEASWHEHLAGLRAAETARAQGSQPAAIDAIASATAGPVTIGGFTLWPASEGTVWTLRRLAREFSAWAEKVGMPRSAPGAENGTRELIELGLSTLAFCDARECWQAMELGRFGSLVVKAEQLMWQTSVEVSKQLENHFMAQMDRIRSLTPDEDSAPGKSQAAGNGISPGTPIPQAVPASPPSNGSPQNTTSPLPQPSGALLSQ